jgi:pimeloyl-ACP methyl ester carboxylesterase
MKPLFLATAIVFTTSFSAGGQHPSKGATQFVTSSDSVRIAYKVLGNGTPALVFVHGWSCDKSYWKGQLEPFSQRYKVVAVDLGGHGESGLERKAWTIASFGSDVAAVVNKLGLNKVILIGHSMGGDVIAEAARLLPSQVVGLIMVDTYKQLGPGRSPEEVQALVARFSNHFADSTKVFVRSMFLPNTDSNLINHVSTDMASAPPTVALAALDATLSYSREMPLTLQELKLPVIAINAGNAPTDIASMKQCGVEVMIMPEAGHFLFMEDPERFNRLLQDAITKLVQ